MKKNYLKIIQKTHKTTVRNVSNNTTKFATEKELKNITDKIFSTSKNIESLKWLTDQ